MKLTVKTRFNASKEKFEKFGPGMYLAYLPYAQDDSAVEVLAAFLSRTLGVPPSKVEFAGIDMNKNYIFELV